MNIIFDIETNSLVNPNKIWVIVCKDLDTGERTIFRNVHENDEKNKFVNFFSKATRVLGHNIVEFDLPIVYSLLGVAPKPIEQILDTLILSRLIDYPREKGHSIESYGVEFGLEKISFNDFKQYSKEMEEYCSRDVDICELIYKKYLKYISQEEHKASILMEHKFQLIVNDIQNNGFAFNTEKAKKLLESVTAELAVLDAEILKAFPPRLKLIREITPKVTKHGTLSKTDFRWVANGDLSEFNGGPFCRCEWVEFNPSSHKQLVEVLHNAGWQPIDKTQTHINLEREVSRQKHWSKERRPFDLSLGSEVLNKLEELHKTGWKINETNLSTLPDTAPQSARSLAKRILLESRRRTLTEWLGLVSEDNRVHGKFLAIGTWTHRSATQRPNLQNIPNEFDTEGKVKLLGKEFRQLWRAPKNRLLVGVDAEGIQLRIFAHYIDDPEFTDALVRGKKSDKTDPHSFNQRIIGSVCRSRAAAKRFIYALLLGAGYPKLAGILDCSVPEAENAVTRIMERYTGWLRLKKETFPQDAKRGYFIGLDGRKVRIPGETVSERKHLALSGYLQNGEAICMRYATIEWYERLRELEKQFPKLADKWRLVDLIHDEWQTEVPNDMELAVLVAKTQAEALETVGERLGLKCPLAGSYWNEDHHDYTIGTNWYQTH